MFQLENIGDAAAFGSAAHIGNFVNPLDVHTSCIREKHEVIVSTGGEQVLDEILVFFGCAFASDHADDAFSPSPLGAVRADIGALDQSVVRECDNDAFVGDQVFDGDLAFLGQI